ncbi:hypothetical protein M405DRAFT_765597 [Rhizopogon salebrosus TDB-379]|nr:hypothetical protein M405DRAFT_765597 [Rhizopogon salebrosus TDB-379]
MAECGICLEEIKTPVCIPCGHVHCEKCLRAHISSGKDALKSSCPACRNVFHIAVPDPSFIPKKYHDFMVPSVRKLYMDIPSTGPLTAEIEQLKKRVATLGRDRDALMEKCEAYMAASRQHADKEKTARLEARAAREATSQLQIKYDALMKEHEMNLDQSLSQTPSDGRKRKNRAPSPIESVTEPEMKLERPRYVSRYMPRAMRALPRSSMASTSQLEESHDSLPRFVKRQRYSGGPGLQSRLSDECECSSCKPHE